MHRGPQQTLFLSVLSTRSYQRNNTPRSSKEREDPHGDCFPLASEFTTFSKVSSRVKLAKESDSQPQQTLRACLFWKQQNCMQLGSQKPGSGSVLLSVFLLVRALFRL